MNFNFKQFCKYIDFDDFCKKEKLSPWQALEILDEELNKRKGLTT